jgi:DNA polymerase III subunit gamma/tau
LVVGFPSDNDVANFKQSGPGATGVSEFLRTAILQVLGLRVKFIAKSDVVREQAPVVDSPPADDGWAVTAIPGAEPAQAPRAAVVKEPVKDDGPERYGESVVREMLGASFIEEQPLRPRVVPTAQGE